MTTSPPCPGFSDIMEAFFGADPWTPPPPLAEHLKAQAATVNENLTIASRRVILMNHHPAAVSFFEGMAAAADTLRRLIARTEALTGTSEQRSRAERAICREASDCMSRVNKHVDRSQDGWLTDAPDLVWAAYDLTPQQFEHRTAQMLALDGFLVEQWGGGAGDMAADLIARLPANDDRRVIVQCKHTADPRTRIGSTVVQQVSGVRQAHQADLAYVVTTGDFTAPARQVADRLGVGLVDFWGFQSWAVRGHRLLDLLSGG